MAVACGGPAAPAPAPALATTTAPLAAARSRADLVVPPGEGGGAFATPRTLIVPPGWTARVWARVPNARTEAWSPEGDLLVERARSGAGSSNSFSGANAQTPPTQRTVLSGLTQPQGLAFARLAGHWVVSTSAESPTRSTATTWEPDGIVATAERSSPGDFPTRTPSATMCTAPKTWPWRRSGTVYFDVGSSSNANPATGGTTPPRAVIMAVNPAALPHVVEGGAQRRGAGGRARRHGLDRGQQPGQHPYPFHPATRGNSDAFGQVIQAYVNDHPPDEVVPVTQGRDLGWPYCNPDQDMNHPARSLADVPFVPDSVTNPGGRRLDCAGLPPIEVGLPAHSAPLGMSFLEGSRMPAPWTSGAVVAVHGSWDRQPPRPPAVLWLAWDAARHTLNPAVTGRRLPGPAAAGGAAPSTPSRARTAPST